MTHPDQDIIDFLTKDLDLRAAPDWMIERARAFWDGGWLPIETGPKDGTFVLVWDNYYGVWEIARAGHDGVFFSGDWDYQLEATHWRALPNPPKDTEQ